MTSPSNSASPQSSTVKPPPENPRHGRPKRVFVSQEALNREIRARKTFTTERISFEQSILFPSQTYGEIVPLLRPDCHLTRATWKTFRDWVRENHDGWTVRRRRTQDAEDLIDCPVREKRLGFFVDAIYEQPGAKTTKVKPSTKKKKQRTKRKPRGDADVSNNNRRKPNREGIKRVKISDDIKTISVGNYQSLPETILLKILSYLDPATLDTVMRVAPHPINIIARDDKLWRPHLRRMLVDRFDNAFQGYDDKEGDWPRPLSQRPLQSTSFPCWWNDWMEYFKKHSRSECDGDHHNKENNFRIVAAKSTVKENHPMELLDDYRKNKESYPGLEGQFEWLINNVDLCEYYRRANDCAEWGEMHCVDGGRKLHFLHVLLSGCVG